MILQFLLQIFILLSLPKNAFTLKSHCKSTCRNDSKSFPSTIEPNLSSYNRFDADRSSDKSFIKRTNLEFLREKEKKSFNRVDFCQGKFPRPPQQIFNASDEEDGNQECSFNNFEGDHQENETILDGYCSVDKNYNYSKETARSMTTGVPIEKDDCEAVHISNNLQSLHFNGLFYILLIIVVACVGNVVLLVAWRWLCKRIKKRKDSKMNKKFFEQNGGLLLKQLLNSCDANVDRAFKLFTSMEIDKATDHFNVKRILGQGGQGTVYKGMLVDGRIMQ